MREANFDGLVGPTHNYAGLSWGNVASKSHAGQVSRPREAALQGLVKMKRLADLGLVQGVLPPQERPDMVALRRLGFRGSDADVLAAAQRQNEVLLAACSSASSMWAANAATVAPSADTEDGRLHFTPANLRATVHRSLEPEGTARALRRIFAGERFAHHEPLPAVEALGDEGAANHTRLRAPGSDVGLHVFVYGRRALDGDAAAPARFPARQTLEASQAVARLNQLPHERTLFVQQNPDVIDRGVFHNDVIAVGNDNVLLHHEHAFVDTAAVIDRLQRALGGTLVPIRVPAAQLGVEEAVRSYLFNSQLVTLPDATMVLLAPAEAQQSEPARRFVEHMLADGDNPVGAVHYLDLRQSMHNGGGPACLRLRVTLTDGELQHVHRPCLFDDTLHEKLRGWIERHYREELRPQDLADPQLLEESRAALDELTGLLQLGADFYPFQQA